MQKSKSMTIVVIAIIFIYAIIANFKLIIDYNTIYLYFINPMFWIFMAIGLKFILGKSYSKKKLKKEILHYVLIAVLVYIITYMVSGLFITFGTNPYNRTLKGIVLNLWMFGSVIIAKEYIRYKLIENVYENDKKKIAILISIVYIFIELEISRYLSTNITMLFIIKEFAQNFMPLVAINVLCSYTSIYSNCFPAILYNLLTKLYLWLSPILPNSPWVMTAIIDTVIPIILFLYIRYINNKKSMLKSKEDMMNTDPRNTIPLVILIILGIWFAIGIFPIKPVAIASGSMEKEICVGDIAIIKKCNANDIVEGDIIEYQMEGYTVIHRVLSKKQKNGEYYFITKGDNNSVEDSNPVSEDQLIGKVVLKIKYLGYPAVWLHIIQTDEQVEVETGK